MLLRAAKCPVELFRARAVPLEDNRKRCSGRIAGGYSFPSAASPIELQGPSCELAAQAGKARPQFETLLPLVRCGRKPMSRARFWRTDPANALLRRSVIWCAHPSDRLGAQAGATGPAPDPPTLAEPWGVECAGRRIDPPSLGFCGADQ